MGFLAGRIAATALLAGTGMAMAHLSANSLSIKGGQTFTTGEQVTLTWGVSVGHDGTNIDVSTDGGSTWKSIKSGIKETSGTNTFKMTMPGEATTHAKVRVCQGTATACATIKASQPSTAPYALVSNEFTLSAASSGIGAAAAAPYALGFEQSRGKVEGFFELGGEEDVALQAFDLQGRLLATLLSGRFHAGAHRFSVPAASGMASARALIFRLKLGETVRTQAWTRL